MLPWKGASFWKENQLEFGRVLFQHVSLLWLLEDCSWGMAIGHFLANYSCMETLWPVFASYSLKAQSVHRRVGCGWFLGFFWAERGVKKCEVFRDITQGWWFPIFFLIKPYLWGQFIQFERYLHRLFNHHLWLSIKKTQKRRPKSYIYHLSTTRGSSNSPRLFKYPSTKNPTTNPTKKRPVDSAFTSSPVLGRHAASPHRRLRRSTWSRSGDSFGWTSDVSTLHTSCLDHE